MAEISSGPVSTLPGHRETLPQGTTCDVHPDKPAAARVQGETDSFGCEYNDLCQECLDEMQAHRHEARCGTCDWCGGDATDLRDTRDYDEGLYGRVYRVCGACRSRENERHAAEAAEWGDRDDFYCDDE